MPWSSGSQVCGPRLAVLVLLAGLASRACLADTDHADFATIDDLTLVGSARQVVNARTGGMDIRLVRARVNEVGGMYLAAQQEVAFSFTCSFKFRITGSVSTADGMAFILQNHDAAALGSLGAGCGYVGIENSLAVVFKDFDPLGDYISIQTRGRLPNTDDPAASLGRDDEIQNLGDLEVHEAKVLYTAGQMEVYLDGGLRVRSRVNLAELLDLDGGRAWVGFTAATGGYFANYDILEWTFRERSEVSLDCDHNSLVDVEEIRDDPTLDRNQDGLLDVCRIGPYLNALSGHYYEIVRSPGITWPEARDAAVQRVFARVHGYLATITSREENDFLVREFSGLGRAWMGASDQFSEGDWRWRTGPEAGQSVEFTAWAPGEPNNMNNGEDYLEWNDVGWNDSGLPSSESFGYLVEYPTVGEAREPRFKRGDADGDGSLALSDGVAILRFLFLGARAPACADALDADDNSLVNASDAIGILSYLFLGTAPPEAPFPACGVDRLLDTLDCESYGACPE